MYRIALMAIVLVIPASVARSAEHTKDTPETIKKAVTDGKAILLDVREKAEWEEGHLQDAKLLPLSNLKAGASAEQVAKTLPKGSVVYCHCGSGFRCLKAAEILQKLGYDVRPVKQGYKDLLEAGFPKATK